MQYLLPHNKNNTIYFLLLKVMSGNRKLFIYKYWSKKTNFTLISIKNRKNNTTSQEKKVNRNKRKDAKKNTTNSKGKRKIHYLVVKYRSITLLRQSISFSHNHSENKQGCANIRLEKKTFSYNVYIYYNLICHILGPSRYLKRNSNEANYRLPSHLDLYTPQTIED